MKKTTKLDAIDVAFDPKPLTEDEKRLISEAIRKDKEQQKNTIDTNSLRTDDNAVPFGKAV